MTTEPDEEEVRQDRPNAWWAEQRQQEKDAASMAGMGFGGNYRAIPTPHSGHQEVHAEDTLGDEEHCWCGQPIGHDWPGKAAGKKHPRGATMSTAGAHVTSILSTGDVMRFSTDVRRILLSLVNTYGVRYRFTGASALLLYPLDGGNQTLRVTSQRPAKEMEKAILKWAKDHVPKSVTPETVVKLAEKVNSPEHPVRPSNPQVYEIPEPTSETSEVWTEHLTAHEGRPTGFETNGTVYRCIECRENGQESLVTDPGGIGGHRMTHHQRETAEQTIWSPATRAKAEDTKRFNRLAGKVAEAVELLQSAAGIQGESAYVKELEAENERLSLELNKAVKDKADAEARLALIKEAMKA